VREELAELSVAEVRRRLVVAFGMMVRGEEQVLRWSRYRRRARQKARVSHAKRRSKLLAALNPLVPGQLRL
jgi:hypothetical protein